MPASSDTADPSALTLSAQRGEGWPLTNVEKLDQTRRRTRTGTARGRRRPIRPEHKDQGSSGRGNVRVARGVNGRKKERHGWISITAEPITRETFHEIRITQVGEICRSRAVPVGFVKIE